MGDVQQTQEIMPGAGVTHPLFLSSCCKQDADGTAYGFPRLKERDMAIDELYRLTRNLLRDGIPASAVREEIESAVRAHENIKSAQYRNGWVDDSVNSVPKE